MNLISKSVDSLSKTTTRRRTRPRVPTYRTRLLVEELEPRCVLSGGALPGPDLLPLALSPEQAAGQSINLLGQNLYSLLQGQSGGSSNLFLSPASIVTALAMTDAGAVEGFSRELDRARSGAQDRVERVLEVGRSRFARPVQKG